MSKMGSETIEKFQIALQKDPNSQIFAALGEAYRELKMMAEAEKVVRDGMKRHPHFVGGLVTFAKILRDLGKFQEALAPLKKAVQLSPENILAHQLMAEVHLANRQPKEALKAFKMVLFLNPGSKTSQNAVNKLESLTADEYDDEVFEMSKLHQLRMSRSGENKADDNGDEVTKVAFKPATENARAMERMLSLIDAFIVRNDLEKAHLLLQDTLTEFGEHPEIQRRMKSLQVRTSLRPESAAPLRPLDPAEAPPLSREKRAQEKKLKSLNEILTRIERYRHAVEI